VVAVKQNIHKATSADHMIVLISVS
jgi:hypothetical protein